MMKTNLSLVAGMLIGMSVSSTALAAPTDALAFVGTITQLQGEVQVFSHPSKTIQGPAPHALFEGEYYSVRSAKIGDKVEQGNIVRTAPGGLAKLVFENGDQVHVGNATAYRIFWEQKAKSRTTFRLLYGKLRSVVSKVGPRNNLEVKTSDVVMGVRGTDFFVERRGAANTTQISILRGAVEVKPAVTAASGTKGAAKPLEVKAGYSAAVTAAPRLEPVVEIRKTDQGQLSRIRQISEIKKPEAPQEISQKVVQEVKKLEAKAVETTLADIKTHDKALFEQVAQVAGRNDVVLSEFLNNKTVEKLIQTAPPAPKKSKPSLEELDEADRDSYDKYFRQLD